MEQYECRIKGLHETFQWFNIGEQLDDFAAKTEMLCRASGQGGQSITLEEIECRKLKNTVKI